MPTQIGAHAGIAVGFVSQNALGATFGLASCGAFDAGAPKGFKNAAFMTLSSGQDAAQGFALPSGADVNFGAEAALTTAQSLERCLSVCCACRLLMGADHTAIQRLNVPIQVACWVGLFLQRAQATLPEASFAPTLETTGDARPVAVAFRHSAPWRASSVNP